MVENKENRDLDREITEMFPYPEPGPEAYSYQTLEWRRTQNNGKFSPRYPDEVHDEVLSKREAEKMRRLGQEPPPVEELILKRQEERKERNERMRRASEQRIRNSRIYINNIVRYGIPSHEDVDGLYGEPKNHPPRLGH